MAVIVSVAVSSDMVLGNGYLGRRGGYLQKKDFPGPPAKSNSRNLAKIQYCLGFGISLLYFDIHPRVGRSGVRIPVGVKFSALVQTGLGAYPASCTMGTVSYPGVKRLGRGVDHPLHLASKSKKEWSCTSTPLLSLHGMF